MSPPLEPDTGNTGVQQQGVSEYALVDVTRLRFAPALLQLGAQRGRKGAAADGADGRPANETGGGYYRKYILEDLKPWAEAGITKVRPQGFRAIQFLGR